MKFWLMIAGFLIVLNMVQDISSMDGEGLAYTLVEGTSLVIMVLLIGGIVWLYKRIRVSLEQKKE